jgi:hypothetical protein
MAPGRPRTVSVTELSEYAFCPRAHYYRMHPDGTPPAPGSRAQELGGVEYHRRTLGRERAWSEASPWPWIAALLVGLAVLGVVVWSALP